MLVRRNAQVGTAANQTNPLACLVLTIGALHDDHIRPIITTNFHFQCVDPVGAIFCGRTGNGTAQGTGNGGKLTARTAANLPLSPTSRAHGTKLLAKAVSRRLRSVASAIWGTGSVRQKICCNYASVRATYHLNIQFFDFFSQGIAVQSQQIRRPDLIAAGRRKTQLDQRPLNLAHYALVQAGGW